MDDSELMLDNNNENNANFDANNNLISKLNLKQQVMMNQFMSITGCTIEQSIHLLASTNWQYQIALSLFFDDYSLSSMQPPPPPIPPPNPNKPLVQSKSNGNSSNNLVCLNSLSLCAPSNTPVTPPNLEYLEKAFSKLNSTLNTNTTGVNTSSINNNQSASSTINYLNANSSNLAIIKSTTNTPTSSTSISSTNGNQMNSRLFGQSKSMPVPINPSQMYYINNLKNNSNYNN